MTLVAAPLEEEFSLGHVGRLARINGCHSAKEFLIRLWKRNAPHTRNPVGERIAGLCDMDPDDYVGAHSLTPFARPVTQTKVEGGFAAVAAESVHCGAVSPLRSGAFLCPACVAEDEATFGISYWRRIHQIPGVYACPDHRKSLLHVSDDAAFDGLPSQAISFARPRNQCLARLQFDQPVLRRYVDLAGMFLRLGKPLMRLDVSARLSLHARANGMRVSVRGTRDTMSDRIASSFPREWIGEMVPRLTTKIRGVYYISIDGACLGARSQGWIYAAILSVVAPTAQEGVDLMVHGPDETVRSWAASRERIAHERQRTRRELLIRSYLEHGGIHKFIATVSGKDLPNTNRELRRLGLPSLYRYDQGAREQLLRFLREAPIDEIHEWADRTARTAS